MSMEIYEKAAHQFGDLMARYEEYKQAPEPQQMSLCLVLVRDMRAMDHVEMCVMVVLMFSMLSSVGHEMVSVAQEMEQWRDDHKA